MSLTTYDPSASNVALATSVAVPNTAAAQIAAAGAQSSPVMNSALAVQGSGMVTNPTNPYDFLNPATMQPVSNGSTSPSTSGAVTAPSTDFVTTATNWVQQNPLMAAGIAAALFFMMKGK